MDHSSEDDDDDDDHDDQNSVMVNENVEIFQKYSPFLEEPFNPIMKRK